jgi:hypothetical protein
MTKRDLVIDKLQEIVRWSSRSYLEDALQGEKNSEYSLLSKDLLHALSKNKLMQNPDSRFKFNNEWYGKSYCSTL